MSSSSRLSYLVDSAYRNNDKEACRRAFDEYMVSQCYYPTWQTIYDAHSQTYRKIMLNCGKCYHCMETKINEWCTRMYAHAEDFKNVYFVTLTYRSFHDSKKQVNRLILDKLQDAVWHYDNKNATRRFGYNPCLLVKSHYQNFIKRLRKNTGLNDITYVLSGEYGHDYGRPHFHMILFTNGVLTRQAIIRAWSVCLWRSSSGEFTYRRNQKKNGQAFDFPIGRIDFNDLVANGTFNTTAKIRVDGTYMNAANCFAYVCKYVCKRDNANYNRVKIAFYAMFHKKRFCKVYSNELEFDHIKQYLSSVGYPYEKIDDCINHLKQYVYEKNVFSPDGNCYSSNLKQTKKTTLFGCDAEVDVYPAVYPDFREYYSPFCEFSRSTPIGSLYAKRNIQEFADGVFTKPLLQEQSFVVPSYFRRKAKDYLYRLRVCRKTFRSTSYCLGGLSDLRGRLEKSSLLSLPPREHFHLSNNITDYKQALSQPYRVFKDAYSGERILLADGFARYYKYQRSGRDYINTQNIPLYEWIRNSVSSLQEEFKRYAHQQYMSLDNLKKRDVAFCKLTDLGLNPSSLRDSFVERSKVVRDEIQKDYNSTHLFAE